MEVHVHMHCYMYVHPQWSHPCDCLHYAHQQINTPRKKDIMYCDVHEGNSRNVADALCFAWTSNYYWSPSVHVATCMLGYWWIQMKMYALIRVQSRKVLYNLSAALPFSLQLMAAVASQLSVTQWHPVLCHSTANTLTVKHIPLYPNCISWNTFTQQQSNILVCHKLYRALWSKNKSPNT